MMTGQIVLAAALLAPAQGDNTPATVEPPPAPAAVDATAGRKETYEQIEVMRLLWTNEVVDYTGRWHRIDRAGINPLPIQRPIPLWMGADEEIAVKRVARLADGWFSHLTPDETGRAGLERFRGYVREAGRDPGRIGVEGRVPATGTPDDWTRRALAFREMGMTHLEFRTGGSRLPDLDAHIDAMRRFREAAPVF